MGAALIPINNNTALFPFFNVFFPLFFSVLNRYLYAIAGFE